MRSERSPNAGQDTLGLDEAAELMDLGYKAMKELVDTGEVPALSCNQKHVVLLREDVIAYIREKGRQQAQERKNRLKRQPARLTAPAPVARAGRRKTLPDLSAYELTTGSPPDQTRAG